MSREETGSEKQPHSSGQKKRPADTKGRRMTGTRVKPARRNEEVEVEEGAELRGWWWCQIQTCSPAPGKTCPLVVRFAGKRPKRGVRGEQQTQR